MSNHYIYFHQPTTIENVLSLPPPLRRSPRPLRLRGFFSHRSPPALPTPTTNPLPEVEFL